jgi:pSer/pThr/pTyr-binding forkhead associated (FHA) protein
MAIIIQTVDGVVANRFDVDNTVLKIGRNAANQVRIDDLAVSNQHAKVYRETDDKGISRYFLEDLGSTNGSFVNEKKVSKQQLHHKDTLRIGWNVFTFIDENEVNLEKTSEIKKSWIPGVYISK